MVAKKYIISIRDKYKEQARAQRGRRKKQVPIGTGRANGRTLWLQFRDKWWRKGTGGGSMMQRLRFRAKNTVLKCASIKMGDSGQ